METDIGKHNLNLFTNFVMPQKALWMCSKTCAPGYFEGMLNTDFRLSF